MIRQRGFARKMTICAMAGAIVVALCAGCSSAPASSSSSQEADSSFAAEASDAGAGASSNAASSSSEATSSASSAAAEETLVIGEESDGTQTMTVINKLGAKITDIAFAPAGSEDEPEYLMESGQTWKSGKEAIVHFPSAGEAVNYDVHVKSGDASYTLHNMLLDGVEELTISIEGDIAYASFERDGSAISTLRDEADLAEQAAAGEADAEAPAEEAPAEEYYEDEYYEEETYYEEPAQEEDSCVEGGIQLR